MKNTPIPVTKQTLLEVLHELIALVEDDDSFEGSLEYLMPDDNDPELTAEGERALFMLKAAYRVGNSQGQGGMRMIGMLR